MCCFLLITHACWLSHSSNTIQPSPEHTNTEALLTVQEHPVKLSIYMVLVAVSSCFSQSKHRTKGAYFNTLINLTKCKDL